MTMPNLTVNVDPQVFNEVYKPILYDKKKRRYNVLYGGAGSGKSVFVGQYIVLKLLQEKGHTFLVCRKVARTLRNSVFALFKQIIVDWGLYKYVKINKSDMTITFPNGNTIIFAGLDDVEKLKSIITTGIWIEEASEVSQEDFLQLDIRLRGKTKFVKQIFITFNPISAQHWLKSYFFDKNNVKALRSGVIFADDDLIVLKSTYLDNKFIEENYKRVLESKKETDINFYNVYALGEWGIVSNNVFPLKYILKQEVNILDPTTNEEYEEIKVFKLPEPDVEYIAAIDPSRGTGKDNHVLTIFSRDGEQVLEFAKNNIAPELFARKSLELIRRFNDAYLIIENNVNGELFHHIICDQGGYWNVYSNFRNGKRGWDTTVTSKPIMVSDLADALRGESIIIHSKDLLEELKTYVFTEKGTMEAAAGCKDDRVIAAALFLQANKSKISIL